MNREQRLTRQDLKAVLDRLRQGPSDEAVNPPLASSYRTGDAGDFGALHAAIINLVEEVSGLRAAVQGQTADRPKRGGTVLNDKAPRTSASSDAGQRRRPLPVQSLDLAPCVLIERPFGSKGQASPRSAQPAAPKAQPPLQLESPLCPTSLEVALAAHAPAAVSYTSQRRMAAETPRVLPVRFQDSQLLNQKSDRSGEHSNFTVDSALVVAIEQGGGGAGGGGSGGDCYHTLRTYSDFQGDTSKLDSAQSTAGSLDTGDYGQGSGTQPVRANSEPLDGQCEAGGGGGLHRARGTRGVSEPWVRPVQRSGGSGSLSARGQRGNSGRWGRRGDDPTSAAYASQGAAPQSARFFHPPPPPPPRGTWAIEPGAGTRVGLPRLAMRYEAADDIDSSRPTSGGRSHGQGGWVAALAAAMDIDDSTDGQR